jgi:hypothetical protein
MKNKTSRSLQKSGRGSHVQGEGPNWVLVAGGVLLSTLSVRLGCKLKQLFDGKQQNNTSKGLMSSHAPIFIYNLDLVSLLFVCSLISADCAKLQIKEGLKHVSCTRTSTGSVTKLAATAIFQVLYL